MLLLGLFISRQVPKLDNWHSNIGRHLDSWTRIHVEHEYPIPSNIIFFWLSLAVKFLVVLSIEFPPLILILVDRIIIAKHLFLFVDIASRYYTS